jgi:hypothetical protein
MTRFWRISAVATFALLSVTTPRRPVLRTGIMHVEAQQAVKVIPYVAEYWLTSYVMKPKGEVVEKRQVARRSDGAKANVVTVVSGSEVIPHRTVVLPDGRRIFLNDDQGVRSTFYMSDQELAQFKNSLAKSVSAQDCGNEPEVFLGTDSRLGYRTQVWKIESKSDDGSTLYRMTTYRAPELGCLDMKTTLGEVQPNGKVKLHWALTAQSVSQTEPPEADLQIGVSYREVLPSKFDKLTYKIAALADEASKSAECQTHNCGPIEDFKRQWSKQDNDYKTRLNGIGRKR